MPLLNDHLSVWEIGHRWAGLDPPTLRLTLPLLVRDNFRTLMDAVLRLHLSCMTLSVEKWTPEADAPPEFFIRHHLEDVRACIAGSHFSRKLLRHALIDRWDMYLWCERQGVPLPEFWFPPGWKLAYEWPEEEQVFDIDGVPLKPGIAAAEEPIPPVAERLADASVPAAETEDTTIIAAPMSSTTGESDEKLRVNQRVRVACQVIAGNLWKQRPDATIAAMVRDDAIQVLCGGSHYDDVTVRDWIKVVAPDQVRGRRGRPKKNNPPEGE